MGMAHEDGTIVAGELTTVAEACGQNPDQVRSCLRRLVSEGLFVRNGAGRHAVFSATTAGLAALGATVERTRLAYGQDADGRGWDRQWRLVGFAVPEGRRSARDSFREALVSLGGAAIQGGLYVSPHPWHKDVIAEAHRLGVADRVTLATTESLDISGERDPKDLARRLWPVDDIATEYQAFVDEYASVPAALEVMRRRREKLGDEAFLPGALAMAVAFSSTFDHDPLLPPELLPRPWPGREARDLLVTCRRRALSIRTANGRAGLFRFYDIAVDSVF